MGKKLRTFIVDDEQFGNVILGDIEVVLQYVKSELQELKDGGEISITLTRQDMTKKELKAVPEI